MTSENFTITEHWSPCQRVRGYSHSVNSDDAKLFISVKEYRPRRSASADPSAVTIIASPGNGFPKECYEALWDELLAASSRANAFKIRAIWIAEMANQGASHTRNAGKLGDDPNWLDHSRDMLLMLHQFQDRMQPPFVGVAHSMGGAQIAHLALLHPRLFHSLVLIDPVILDRHPPGPNAAFFTTLRRETWASRVQAEAQMRKNPLFRAMDARALNAYLAHGLRDDTASGGVTLTTPKAQEAWSYLRSNFEPLPGDAATPEARNRERLLAPDLLPDEEGATKVFIRAESLHVYEMLPHVRPRTLFVYGRESHINHPAMREQHLARTGTGRDGNGGFADGGIEVRIIDGATHLVVLEKPAVVAQSVVEWLDKEVGRWKEEREFLERWDRKKSKNGGRELSEKWIESVKKPSSLARLKEKEVAKL